jgi:hypothetical protein
MELPERLDTVAIFKTIRQKEESTHYDSSMRFLSYCENLNQIDKCKNMPFLKESKIRIRQITQMYVK